MAKHVRKKVQDTKRLIIPAASREAVPQMQELLNQLYKMVGQDPPPLQVIKALRRARSGLLTIELNVTADVEQRETRAAQLARLQLQERNLTFKKRMLQESHTRLVGDMSQLVRRKKSIKKAIDTNIKSDKGVGTRLDKTRRLIARVRSQVAEEAKRKSEKT